MRPWSWGMALTTLVLLAPIGLSAQSGESSDPDSDTMTVVGLGSVTFAVSTHSAVARREFGRGLLLLHLFEYPSAAEAFRAARKADPAMSMAYWGEAMTHTHPVWNEQDMAAARAVLRQLAPTPAERVAKATTARERAYIEAVEVLYGPGPKARRDTLYEQAMDRLSTAYPNDDEARLFHALALLGLSQGVRDLATYMRAAALAQEVFERHPTNPGATHYLIHAVDDPVHAVLGLRAAKTLLRTATAAGHGQHMTSHIFLALGMWDDLVAANELAIRVVDSAAAARKRPPAACGHYPAWLHYGYLQQGRAATAERMLERCRERALRAEKMADAADPDASPLGSYADMWARQVLDAPSTAAAVATRMEKDISDGRVDFTRRPFPRVPYEVARAYLAWRRGDSATAVAAREGLIAARSAIDDDTAVHPDEPETRLLQQRMDVLELEVDALSDDGDPIALLRRAAQIEDGMPYSFGPPFVTKPAAELLGEVLLRAGQPAAAVEAFRAALNRTPRRTASLLGLARAQAASGATDEARLSYGELTRIWSVADADVEGLDEARASVDGVGRGRR